MIERRLISEEDRELYRYGIQLLAEKLLGLCSILLICILTGRVLQGVVFYLSYSMLRKYAGGYHAGKFITCYLSSCFMVFLCVMLSFLPFASVTSLILFALGASVVFLLSPAQHSARPLEDCEKRVYRKRTRLTLLLEFLIFTALYLLKLYSLCFVMGCAVFLLGVLVALQYIANRKNNTE